mmetsp:Transcript_43076/g.122063  ORF Transcript_43076/g.122063 Transcript_43076/m.122063 type:complete len:233 (+) Transcript_43076:1061-1759(+)
MPAATGRSPSTTLTAASSFSSIASLRPGRCLVAPHNPHPLPTHLNTNALTLTLLNNQSHSHSHSPRRAPSSQARAGFPCKQLRQGPTLSLSSRPPTSTHFTPTARRLSRTPLSGLCSTASHPLISCQIYPLLLLLWLVVVVVVTRSPVVHMREGMLAHLCRLCPTSRPPRPWPPRRCRCPNPGAAAGIERPTCSWGPSSGRGSRTNSPSALSTRRPSSASNTSSMTALMVRW